MQAGQKKKEKGERIKYRTIFDHPLDELGPSCFIWSPLSTFHLLSFPWSGLQAFFLLKSETACTKNCGYTTVACANEIQGQSTCRSYPCSLLYGRISLKLFIKLVCIVSF